MRRPGPIAPLAAFLAVLELASPAKAAITPALAGLGCQAAIAAAERGNGLPAGLLGAIARVESGRRNAETGQIEPWPWTADVEGQGYFYETKAQAVAAVRRFQADGARSIDVGCMQVNLLHHPDAFPDLEAAFDPAANAAYAARFLGVLHEQTGDWGRAAGMYHSATPALGAEYQRKVMAALPDAQRLTVSTPAPAPAARNWAVGPGPSGITPFGLAAGGGGFRRTLSSPTAASTQLASAVPFGRTLAAYRAMPVRTALFARVPILARR